MKSKKQAAELQEIENLLESDDELPHSYNENPEIPAYVNDERFNPIVFRWIDNPEMQAHFSNTANKQTESLNECQNETDDTLEKDLEKKYITKGYLSKQDLLCVKYIAGSVPDALIFWFVDFLVRKNIQSKYQGRFKSCLVSTFPSDINYFVNITKKNDAVVTSKKKYKIVIKV
ncbi:uncharacterized protein LOC123694062 [Colias croceus]|uniref:uncharacterized protein LOC123694062 n=1 Tax=Colias crocea TaxID=72248 RepID=UPI001E27FCCD|nr:uncharacterized protein LOC123694062 [Colias croceus]